MLCIILKLHSLLLVISGSTIVVAGGVQADTAITLQRMSSELILRIIISYLLSSNKILIQCPNQSNSTAFAICSAFTSIYLCVTAIELCPASSASTRTPMPLLARRVMNVLRGLWLLAPCSPHAWNMLRNS